MSLGVLGFTTRLCTGAGVRGNNTGGVPPTFATAEADTRRRLAKF